MHRHLAKWYPSPFVATAVAVGVCVLAPGAASAARSQSPAPALRQVDLTEAALLAYVSEIREFVASDPPRVPASFLRRDAEWLDEATRLLTWTATHSASQAPTANIQGMVLLNMSAALDPEVDREARERHFLRAAWAADVARNELPSSFQRRCALAAIWFRQGRKDVPKVIEALDAALNRFGPDGPLLLAQGTLWETIAAMRDEDRPTPAQGKAVDAILALPAFDMRPKPAWLPTRRIYEECASAFKRSLRQSPGLDEARVRLAHAQVTLGEYADAASAVSPLLQRATGDEGNPVPYFAALLHGRAMLALDKPEAAVSSLRRALSLCPACQTARIALSQALRAAGDQQAATQVVRELLNQGGRGVAPDPWWDYATGQRWRLPGLVAEMVREARR